MQLKPRKIIIVINIPQNNSSFLTIEVYGGLHKQVDVFLHNCANAIWS
jgi:hypothetical protein